MSATRFFAAAGNTVRNLALAVCVLFLVNHPLRGGVDANGTETPDGKSAVAGATTTEETTEYKNWIEVGVGGTWTSGDRAQFEQQHWIPGDQPYGGISDMHYEHSVGEKATLTIDGHALWDINDYDIKVELSQPNVGYIRGGYTAFRTWYDGNGGFFPPMVAPGSRLRSMKCTSTATKYGWKWDFECRIGRKLPFIGHTRFVTAKKIQRSGATQR